MNCTHGLHVFINTVYPFGINTDLFNKPVKSYSTLYIQNSTFKQYIILIQFIHNLITVCIIKLLAQKGCLMQDDYELHS